MFGTDVHSSVELKAVTPPFVHLQTDVEFEQIADLFPNFMFRVFSDLLSSTFPLIFSKIQRYGQSRTINFAASKTQDYVF